MSSPIINVFFNNRVDLENSLGERVLYISLQGRLGNQLFGLSDAYSLHKKFDLKIAIDITEVLSSGFGVPEWTKYTLNWDWLVIISNLNTSSQIYSGKRFNLGSVRNLDSASPVDNFHGFMASLEAIYNSGLFNRGEFPFNNLEFSKLKDNDLAVSMRLGDYYANPHLGILPLSYYKKSINSFNAASNFSEVVLFSDDLKEGKSKLESIGILVNKFQSGSTSLEILGTLSSANFIIGSNSTFAFWGAYFSKAETIFPEPFYLSNPNWHKKLYWEDLSTVRYSKFPRIRYVRNLILSYKSRHK